MWKFLDYNYIFDGASDRLFKVDEEIYDFMQNCIADNPNNEVVFEGLDNIIYRPFAYENKREEKNDKGIGLTKVVINITDKCNLRCSYCVYPNDPSRDHQISGRSIEPEKIDDLISFLSSSMLKNTQISFFGGEPIYRFNYIKKIIIGLAEARPDWGKIFSATSNFTVMSHEVLKFFVDNNGFLMASIDGPRHIHDYNRPTYDGKGSHEKAHKWLRYLIDTFPLYASTNLAVNCVMTDDNFDEINEYFHKTYPEIHNKRFTVATANAYNSLVESDMYRIKLNLSYWVEKRLSELEKLEDILSNPLLLSFCRRILVPIMSRGNMTDGSKRFTSCRSGQKLFVNSDMSFGVCQTVNEQYSGDADSYMTAKFNISKEFSDMLENRCRYCSSAPMCNICYAAVWDGKGLSRQKLDSYCLRFRDESTRWLNAYVGLIERHKNAIERLQNILTQEPKAFA